MKAGKRPRDEAFMNAMWRTGINRAQAFEDSKKDYEAYQIYLNLTESFKGLRDVTEIEKKISQFQDSREVKEAIREEQQQIRTPKRRKPFARWGCNNPK